MSNFQFSRVLTISGPSGSGKTTLVAQLLKRIPNSEPLIRVTTRQKRAIDNSREYIYLSENEFQSWEEEGRLLFPNENHGFWHSMLREQVEGLLIANSVGFVVGDVSYTGAENLLRYTEEHGQLKIISVFLDMQSDDDELRRRMSKRGDSSEAIVRRIQDCKSWIDEARHSTVVDFKFIDALQPKEMVLAEILSILYH